MFFVGVILFGSIIAISYEVQRAFEYEEVDSHGDTITTPTSQHVVNIKTPDDDVIEFDAEDDKSFEIVTM